LSTDTATPSRGLFITFEGSEGCGKTTQIAALRERLEAEGRTVEQVREPGGTVVGEKIRELLQYTPEVKDMCSEAELCLFAASRSQLVREKIGPSLASGSDVIADRFMDSTTVYQGIGRGLPRELVEGINGLAVGDLKPHLTVVLDMDSRHAFERVSARAGVEDRMEQLPPEFYESVRQGYLELARNEPERIEVIDATQTMDEISEIIWQVVCDRRALVHSQVATG